jgi:hypothetical protein
VCVAEEYVGRCECLYVKFCAFSVLGFKGLWGDDVMMCMHVELRVSWILLSSSSRRMLRSLLCDICLVVSNWAVKLGLCERC